MYFPRQLGHFNKNLLELATFKKNLNYLLTWWGKLKIEEISKLK